LTTTTAADGSYSFTNLIPGSYTVTFTTPAGYTSSPSNQGSDDGKDSDPIGGTVTVVLGSGEVNNTVDAGFFQKVNLGNVVFLDNNGNGVYNPGAGGDVPVQSADVALYLDANGDNIPDGPAVATTTTDINGNYNFTNLNPGTYIVSVSIPAGKGITSASANPNDNVDGNSDGIRVSGNLAYSNGITLTSGDEPTTDGDGNNGNLTLDFGFATDTDGDKIGDPKDRDDDNDGISDCDEYPACNGVVMPDVDGDADGDGVINPLDNNDPAVPFIDCNGNGVNDNYDKDGDGVINSKDLDADNDGILDVKESGYTGNTSNGQVLGADADSDGILAGTGGTVDTNDANATNCAGVSPRNTDRTDVADFLDADSDNDGITDVREAAPTTIGATAVASAVDGNNDGRIDGTDPDADGVITTPLAIRSVYNPDADAIFGAAGITATNSDSPAPGTTLGSDAIPDYLDTDSDNDGVTDNIEGQTTPAYVLPSCTDVDCDGKDDVYDNATTGACAMYNAGGFAPANTDGGDQPDYRDTDSDNDGAPDLAEASFGSVGGSYPPSTGVIADADGDGFSDVFDTFNITAIPAGCTPCANNTNLGYGNGGNPSGPLAPCVGGNINLRRSWRNGTVLSVDMLEFTGVYNAGIATLNWKVANEVNMIRYEVERSTDAINFTSIGAVAARNITSVATYSLNDNLSGVTAPVVYYRLRSYDRDGSIKLSKVVPIRLNSKLNGGIVINPNPANNYFILTVKAERESKATIRVIDATGKVVMIDNRVLATGSNTIPYNNIAKLANGLYNVQIVMDSEVYTEKLIIAR
jgi:hypothetical protein